MKIARIIEYFPPHTGGMERHGLILSEEQIKLGHEVDVFIGYGDEKLLPDIYKMPLQFLPFYSKTRRFWFNFWASKQIIRRHRKNPYNIVHLHGDFVEAYFGSRLSKKIGIPVVLTIHGGLNPKILNKNSAKIFNKLQRIICVSGEIKKSLAAIGVDSSKIFIVSSGVYLEEFKKAKTNINYPKPIIVSVGALTKQKGFDYLVRAFEAVRNLSKCSLLIIGSGLEESRLKKLAIDIDDIYFLGALPHERVVEILINSDIFVLASITMPGYYEGVPTSLMEAMAAGLPVVATSTGGIPELIKDGENGILVEEKNNGMLADAIMELIKNRDTAEKMSRQNLEDVAQKDWPLIARKITDLYL